MVRHVVSLKVYISIFLALLVMTALTIQVAFLDLGPLNIYVAMSIAVFKAVLVVLFFMHLRYSSSLTKLFVVSGMLWLGILISLTISDYFTRPWQNPPGGWVEDVEAAPQPPVVNPH
jgi:cytochrome c oxidase subunit 4